MTKKNVESDKKKIDPVKETSQSQKKNTDSVNNNDDSAKEKTESEKHTLQKRMRSMAAPGGKGQFNRMLAMTQPTKKQQAAASEK